MSTCTCPGRGARLTPWQVALSQKIFGPRFPWLSIISGSLARDSIVQLPDSKCAALCMAFAKLVAGLRLRPLNDFS